MGLLNIIKEDESLKFISLKEAINLLAEKTNSNIYEVATYLLNKNVPAQLDSHARQNNYRIEATSSSMDETHWYGENYCSVWLNFIAENEKNYSSFRVGVGAKYNKGCEENFWNRADFLNLECIRDLNVFSEKDTTINKQQLYIWDTNYLDILKNDVSNPDLDEYDLFDNSFNNYLNEFDLAINQKENNTKQIENQLPPHIKILAMNDYFTIVESACFISFDEPGKIQAYIDSGDFTYDAWRYGEHIQAVKVIENGIRASNLDIENDGMIPRASLQQFLYERNHIIIGFNDNQPRYAYPTVGYASPESYQKERAQLLKEFKQLESELEQEKKQSSLLILDCQTSQSEIEQLKAKIVEIENAKNNNEIDIINSDLLLISALLNTLKNEIKVKANKSQSKILQKIEDEHKGIKGLSKSRTEKVIAMANKLYKPLI